MSKSTLSNIMASQPSLEELQRLLAAATAKVEKAEARAEKAEVKAEEAEAKARTLGGVHPALSQFTLPPAKTWKYRRLHKLSSENLRSGLRSIDLYREIVQSNDIPEANKEKLISNAIRLAGSAVMQEFHAMIQEGLEYSYLTTGLGNVQLWVPYDDPTTLYYKFCEPNLDIETNAGGFENPRTEIQWVLCLCLMSCRSRVRDHGWRNRAREGLPTWETDFNHIQSQIPSSELQQHPPDSEYTGSEAAEDTASECLPLSSPAPTTPGPVAPTPSQSGCAPSEPHNFESEDATDPDFMLGRKRGFSQVTASPTTENRASPPRTSPRRDYEGQSRPHLNEFCTQCGLLGLQQGGVLDDNCPNVQLHHTGTDMNKHPIDAQMLVLMLKQQLDKDLDNNCMSIGRSGSYEVSIKITSSLYGYTVIGKGTTLRLWEEVSQEADVDHVL
ncbi:hypothetical protein LOZ48_006106 [Ophidiomyces ophidiicola]|nr:hypothetical protein LOZ48_006106 [Ophidiomyces ophidiicola]